MSAQEVKGLIEVRIFGFLGHGCFPVCEDVGKGIGKFSANLISHFQSRIFRTQAAISYGNSEGSNNTGLVPARTHRAHASDSPGAAGTPPSGHYAAGQGGMGQSGR